MGHRPYTPEDLRAYERELNRYLRKLYFWERAPSHMRGDRPRPPPMCIELTGDGQWVIHDKPPPQGPDFIGVLAQAMRSD